jgi:carbamoyl-phosphate synthase L subunit-like protein
MMTKPIGIFYEHPEWFKPLFATLDRRGLPYEPILADAHRYDPSAQTSPFGLVFNRVSASSYLRGHTQAILYARQYLDYLDMLGVPMMNGPRAFDLDLSKARQLAVMTKLGLPHPRSRVVNSAAQMEAAAAELEYPIIVKPNLGGSGALMRRFDSPAELHDAVADGTADAILGIDLTAIVQEFHPARGGSIVRVEALDDRFLYAIRIHNGASQNFNLCPADICQTPEQTPEAGAATPLPAAGASADDFEFCPVDAPVLRNLQIEAATPPSWVIDGVLAIFRAGNVDVGGVEYLESERDGRIYLYDVNTLSNFVTDAPNLVGFDPFERLVDVLERRAVLSSLVGAAAAP